MKITEARAAMAKAPAALVGREPLFLRFQVPDADARQLRRSGMMVRLRVRAQEAEHQAKISHVAGAASEPSRTVAITAAIEPASLKQRTPGSFADVMTSIAAAGAAVRVAGPEQNPFAAPPASKPGPKPEVKP